MLYDKTKLFIRESMLYDYKELISSNNFLFQLKPALRYEVVYSLFTRFIDNDFHYLFKHEVDGYRLETGNEFITKFVSQLYCRVFCPNQSVVKRGDYFTELYMIFKGKVMLSCTVKDENEFFTLHPTNFFGDYQILLGLKASEQYKATTSTEFTYCYCIKKKNLLKLLN
jgi:hypothetical protein